MQNLSKPSIPMHKITSLSAEIDSKNYQFTSAIKDRLKNLDVFSETALEWFMMEHYQFSSRNTGFLSTSVDTTKQFKDQGISEELQRNFNEEKNHAKIYKKSLSEIGTNVDKHIEFLPTTNFFNKISKLIASCASTTLGAMYATETAAIFEHEVFWDISHEVLNRRNVKWEKSRLKAFHDLHLNGVEQGHKDGLGIFIDLANDYPSTVNNEQLTQKSKIIFGAHQAIDAMVAWWEALLNKSEAI